MREPSQQLPIAYRGQRTSRGVKVEAQTSTATWRPLDPRLDLSNHSPTGFEWCYGGSGPAQLVLALAASRLPDTLALTVCQRLKRALSRASTTHGICQPTASTPCSPNSSRPAIAADLKRLLGMPGASTALS